MIIAGICVPMMLFVKPIIEYNRENKGHKVEEAEHENYAINDRESEYHRESFKSANPFEIFSNNPIFNEKSHRAHSFGDLFIH
jgi:hypothetical protein